MDVVWYDLNRTLRKALWAFLANYADVGLLNRLPDQWVPRLYFIIHQKVIGGRLLRKLEFGGLRLDLSKKRKNVTTVLRLGTGAPSARVLVFPRKYSIAAVWY